MVIIENDFSAFEAGGRVPKVHYAKFFSTVYFSAPIYIKGIFNIMGGPNQFKVTKGHQVEIFNNY